MKEANVLGGASGIGNGIGGGFGCSLAQAAASKPEWDGEGLPPVGVECEMSYLEDEWYRCVIIAKGEEQIIYKREGCKEFSGHRNNYKFRPIRSEADKKRDEIIEAFKEGLGHAHGLYDLMQIYHLLNNGKIPHIRIY